MKDGIETSVEVKQSGLWTQAAVYFPENTSYARIWHANGFPEDEQLFGDLTTVCAFIMRQVRNFGTGGQHASPSRDIVNGLLSDPHNGATTCLNEPAKSKRRFEIHTTTHLGQPTICTAINQAKGFGLFRDTVVGFAPVACNYLMHHVLDHWRSEANTFAMKMEISNAFLKIFYSNITMQDEVELIPIIASDAYRSGTGARP